MQNKVDEIEALASSSVNPRTGILMCCSRFVRGVIENGFDERTLRRAHERVYRKGARRSHLDGQTCGECRRTIANGRGACAGGRSLSFGPFTRSPPSQEQWLGLIARHLVENLCVDTRGPGDPAGFHKALVASGRARKVFGDQLAPLIERLNYTLAA